ncbi:hypothetical protein HPC49_43955 [Pyxidicoccus fallax]|uniref:Lipoprotein n=1 Tax=Pyxidicoccus fallax TaxID=394095 RepID=A0A848LG70_9BACT|nr:hypothetical protein [Pyxidicoccus fallax]NMO16333.1 hypothetical protein [Pyxidicoccus fallax]NPC85141.1 hypothetical protein [Pyxidicoccus fallax]
MKLPLMAALAALTFWGCSSQSANTRADDATGGSGQTAQSDSLQGTPGDEAREQARDDEESQESPLEASDVVDNERRDRMDAPTVYDGEATGGSGSDSSVTTKDGEKWDVMEEPGVDREPNRGDKEEATGGSGAAGDNDSSDNSGDNTGGVSGGGGQAGGSGGGGSGSGGGGSGGGGGGGGGGL